MSILLKRQFSLPNLRAANPDETCLSTDSPLTTPEVDLEKLFHSIMKICNFGQRGRGSSTGFPTSRKEDAAATSNEDSVNEENGNMLKDTARESCNNMESSTPLEKPESEARDVADKSDKDNNNVAGVIQQSVKECRKDTGEKGYLKCEELHSDILKNYKKRRSRVQGSKKKWKTCEFGLGFEFSLLPRRVPVSDADNADEIEKELKVFEDGGVFPDDMTNELGGAKCAVENNSEDNKNIDCDKTVIQQGNDIVTDNDKVLVYSRIPGRQSVNEGGGGDDQLSVSTFRKKIKPKHAAGKHQIKNAYSDMNFEKTYFDQVLFYERKVNAHALEAVARLQGNMPVEPRRPKKKWKIQKAHKQVKTKHCTDVHKGCHEKALYVKHRLLAVMKLHVGVYFRNTTRLSMKRIDREKGFATNMIKVVRDTTRATSNPAPKVPSKVAKGQEKALGHTLDAYNFDAGLTPDLVNVLQNVQFRDLTPEDYELLLRLDERVKPKTIDDSTLNGLKTDTVSEETAGEICMVCLDPYILGELRKFLPCEHVFHANCIDMWLKNSSVSCPLDGQEIVPS